MKHFLTIILLLFGSIQMTKAQALIAILFGNKIQNDNIALGIYLGLQASDLSNTDSKYLSGFAFGAYTNVKLKGKFVLSNYFIFKSPKGARDVSLNSEVISNAQYPAGSTITRHITYMEISPLLRYSITPSLSFALGPQIGIKTVAKDLYKVTLNDGGRSTVKYKTSDSYSRFDVDVAADLQYALMQGKGLRFNLRYSQGLTNIYKSEVPLSAVNSYFQLGFGIPIGRK